MTNLKLNQIVAYATTQAFRFEDDYPNREMAIATILRETMIRNGFELATNDTTVMKNLQRDILADIDAWEDSPVYGESN